MESTESNVVEYVSGCIQLATLFEVSAYPKPGNVHRTADFDDTKYEHFLASSIAIGGALRGATRRGIEALSSRINFEQVGVGKFIADAVAAMMAWQHGGNTSLGAILLLMPIAVAAGYVWSGKSPNAEKLRKAVSKVTRSTTSEDAKNVYDAIRMAGAGGLGTVKRFDVTSESSRSEIINSGTSLLQIFQLSSTYDSISSEWVQDFNITFGIGYPYFISQIKQTNDCNIAAVHTFLRILSTTPDTLIVRRVGRQSAEEVSKLAEQVLSLGGLTSTSGRNRLAQLDQTLRSGSHKLNPGTTADLTASSLAVAILEGYRP
jgi:triphosphoribosyl-dephospho-CoA synthase